MDIYSQKNQRILGKTVKHFVTTRLQPDMLNAYDKLIGERYQIKDILPPMANMMCYLVNDIANHNRCGMCGTINPDSQSTYCKQCGYHLPDSTFLLIEGDKINTAGFEVIINSGLNSPGILTFFEKFYSQGKYYIVAQRVSNQTLSNCYYKINSRLIRQWAQQLLQTLDELHQHFIYNVDFSLDRIFVLPGGLKLANFSDIIFDEGNNNSQQTENDIRNFAMSFSSFLAKIPVKDRIIRDIQQVMSKVVNGDILLPEVMRKALKSSNGQKRENMQSIIMSETGTSITVGKASDIGVVRALNEDSVVAFELTNILQSVSRPFGFYMVADGMGGHDAGEEASRIAVESISKTIIDAFNNNSKIGKKQARELLEKAVFGANRTICNKAALKKSNMGTTITLALLRDMTAYVFNIGDARTYHLSQGQLKLVTQDHSVVFRLYKIGQIEYDEIAGHPNSNQIICALGEEQLEKNLNNLAQQANHPYFYMVELKPGDGLFLCSDGLWQMIPEHIVERVLNENHHPQEAIDKLVNLARKNGGDDNISGIFVKICK